MHFRTNKKTGGRDRDEKENNKIYILSRTQTGRIGAIFDHKFKSEHSKSSTIITRPVLPAENFQTFLVLRPRLRALDAPFERVDFDFSRTGSDMIYKRE